MRDLELLANRILQAAGGNVRLVNNCHEECFRPFDVGIVRERLSGPVPPGAVCSRCGGPCRIQGFVCRACGGVKVEAFTAVEEYWRRLERGAEPDFAPALIESIHAREKQIGPAAFWPREETTIDVKRRLL